MADDKEQTGTAASDHATGKGASDTPATPLSVEQLTEDRAVALAKVEEQAAALATMTEDRDTKAKELETANATIDDLRAQLAKATQSAAVSKKARPAKLRDAAPMKDSLSGDDLLAALKDGASEIVFSNGATEIDALEPLQVAGPAWMKSAAGVVLTTPVTVKPDRRITIAGFALLDGKGKQLAWAPLRVPLTVQANQEMRLDRQIVFP